MGEQPDQGGLTIVNKRLLRVSAEDWESPEEQFVRIQGAALDALLVASSNDVPTTRLLRLRVLLLFDCMLRVIGEPELSSTILFAMPRFETLQSLFFGAIGSERFINVSASQRITWAYAFSAILLRLSESVPVALLNHRQTYTAAIPEAFVRVFEQLRLDSEEVKRLQPFMLTTKSGGEYNVLLGDMVHVLGERFTNSFHEGLRDIARPKAKDAALRDFGTTFARFIRHQASLGLKLSAELLLDPAFVQTCLVDFMEYHFMKMTRRESPVQEGTLGSLQKLWSRYRNYWELLARKGVLASPANAFPSGNPKLLAGDAVAHRRLVPAANGTTTVTQKLILPVPLHVTDEEATVLLFKQLKVDFNTVQSWLREHLDKFFADYEQGAVLADKLELPEDLSELQRTIQRAPSAHTSIGLAVKYFKSKHDGYLDTSKFVSPIYPDHAARGGPSKELLSRYLGLPSRRDAMALMAFLASHDGRFSEAALSSATLLDANSKRINAVETDGGLTLAVLKERDAGDGWHHVTLKEEAAGYVRRWIQVTAPIRDHMKKRGIEGWRNLFVYVGNPLGAPGHFNRTTNINSAFRLFAQDHEQCLGSLAGQITIPRIRSTRGVLVFLETMDLSQMARELGNTPGTSLRHYLPDSIWDYFTTRWLRIFQNLLIVEATRNTTYMQRALHFGSAAEMDEFLRNHAVTPLLPENEKPSESVASAQNLSEVMVAASPGLFATLLSISAAAEKAEKTGRQLTPQALYWVEFTKRLKAFIESDAFHDVGIKRMMEGASKNLAPTNFEEVVCA